jgi:hypothetical protein
MATYRCPECGASHKEHVPACRLCGAPLDIPVTVRTVTVDQNIAAERFKRKGMGHFVIIGLILVAGIALVAFFIGGIEESPVRRWFYKLPFVEENVDDAWFEWADPDERMIVEVPARMETVDGSDAIDLGATTSAWGTLVGNDTIVVGYTDDLDFEIPSAGDGDDLTRSSTEEALRDAADAAASSQGGYVQRFGEMFTYGDDHLAVDVVIDGINFPEGPAFGSIRLVMAEDEIFFTETIAYERNNDTQRRLRDSLIIVADDPSVTIPTVPEDAPAAGGVVDLSE